MATHDFGVLLGLAYQGFVDELHVDLARHGFTHVGGSVGYVLRAIAEGPINQRQLARRLGITDQGAMKIVDGMERERLVMRVPDPEDGRARRLALATRGRAMLRAARRFHAVYERRLAKELGTSAATARKVLEHIVATAPGAAGRGHLRPM